MKIFWWVVFMSVVFCLGQESHRVQLQQGKKENKKSFKKEIYGIDKVTCELQLDIIKLPPISTYSFGLGLKVIFKNHSNDKLFISINPSFVEKTKNGEKVLFDPGLVPMLMLEADSLQCSQRPNPDLINLLCDSVFNKKNYLAQKPSGKGILFCDSFIFLNPEESFECTQTNISYLLKGREVFENPGKYEFHLVYDPTKQISLSQDLENKIPDVFRGYRRYNKKIISNTITINIR